MLLRVGAVWLKVGSMRLRDESTRLKVEIRRKTLETAGICVWPQMHTDKHRWKTFFRTVTANKQMMRRK
jgi:hypothetical protein